MTDQLFFDSDCISAFLWVNEQSLVAQLYPGRVIIPQPVYDELSYPGTPHLKKRIDQMIDSGQANIMSIASDSPSAELYWQLTQDAPKIIGNGEASCLVLAKEHDGIVASNNFRDINEYICKYCLKHMTTGDILSDALNMGLITEEQGNYIWKNMLEKRRQLGAKSFSEFLLKNKD